MMTVRSLLLLTALLAATSAPALAQVRDQVRDDVIASPVLRANAGLLVAVLALEAARYGLCRECQAVAIWRRETEQVRRQGAPVWTRAGALRARLLALVTSLLQIIGMGAES